MNPRKLAEALRLAADALEEDEDEQSGVMLDLVGNVVTATAPRRPRTRVHPAPSKPPSEVAAQRAKRMLRDRGIRT